MSSVKRIGYFDYRLDNFHAEVYLKALRGPLAARGYEIAGATALVEEPSREWAGERGLPYFDSLSDLARRVDCLMVLAPANPEVHLDMCREAFAHGKITFVDKTFAPSLPVAQEIFALADRHGVAVQSTSALRSTPVQSYVAELGRAVRSLTVYAAGTSLAEYGIHPMELAVSCLGPDVEQLVRLGPDDFPQFTLLFSGDRSATIHLNLRADAPFCATVVTDSSCEHFAIDGGRLFVDAAASILDFFDAQRPLVDRRETLAIRRILDVALDNDIRNAVVSLQPQTAAPL